MDDISYEVTSQVFMPVVVIHSVKDAVSIVIFIMDIKNPIIVIILIIDMIPIKTQNMSRLQSRYVDMSFFMWKITFDEVNKVEV